MSDRTLDDRTFRSKKLAKLSILAFGLFPYIFQQTDDWGCLDTSPDLIKAQRFPLIKWIDEEMIKLVIQEYNEVGMLFLWSEGDTCFGFFVKFEAKSGKFLSKRRKRKTPEPPRQELANYLKDNNHFQPLPTTSYKLSEVKLSKVNKDLKESNSPSAHLSTSVEKSNTKPSRKEIQNRQIEYTIPWWEKLFDQKISTSQLQLLVWGSKDKNVYGFKSYEALWIWMKDCETTKWKPEGSAFLYAKALAKDWGGVKGFSQRAWGRMKDAQSMADIFNEIKMKFGKEA